MELNSAVITVEEICIIKKTRRIYGKLYKPVNEGMYPAVILSHGYNSSCADHEAECICFAENGYIAFAYDFCGGSTRSKSSGKTNDMTLFSEKEDLLDVFAYISGLKTVNKKKIFLFGASQGGMVSAMVAGELQEKVAGMILYYPAFCIPDDWREKYHSESNVPECIDFWGMTIGSNFVKSVLNLDVFESIGKFNNDVLIVYGEYDPIVSKKYMTKAKKVYKNAELVLMKNEGHGFSSIGNEKAKKICVDFLKMHKERDYEDNKCKDIPQEYWLDECCETGTIVSFSYKTSNNRKKNAEKFSKEALVYLPYGYDELNNQQKYNVLYLMHGGSDSPSWFFEGVGKESSCKTIIDNLIESRVIKPCIVCAVSYYTKYSENAAENCKNFYLELEKDIMPIFEKKFHINATRGHRAFGGFSMGAVTTWSVFEHCLDKFEYFLPMSGDCWELGEKSGGSDPDGTTKFLVKSIREQGCIAADFKIYSGCGSNDIAEPNLTPQIEAMKKANDTFIYCDNFQNGNLYECIIKNSGHDRNTVMNVLYNGLPKLFE